MKAQPPKIRKKVRVTGINVTRCQIGLRGPHGHQNGNAGAVCRLLRFGAASKINGEETAVSQQGFDLGTLSCNSKRPILLEVGDKVAPGHHGQRRATNRDNFWIPCITHRRRRFWNVDQTPASNSRNTF